MTNQTQIHPFTVDIPEVALEDLENRLARTRWPQALPGSGWDRGVPADYLRELADYWAHGFDWRQQEAKLNELPQFTTTVGEMDVHFIHVRSPEPEATPLILTHGWPSSPVEFLRLIGPLTDPRSHGGDAKDAFHLILPSLPGYGFSKPTAEPGWGNLFRIAQAWAELMARLGYERYAAYGTDVGSGVAMMLAMVDAEHLIGSYLTGTTAAMPLGPELETDGRSAGDAARAERFNRTREDGMGYLQMQATRPQTLAYALNDSPVGQLAWIVEKLREWSDPAADLPEQAVDRDQMLTGVSVFWFTGSGASSAHATYEGMQVYREMSSAAPPAGEPPAAGPPTGVGVFAADTTIREIFPARCEHWAEFERGGHFPAMEAPDLLIADLRDFFRGHRERR